MLTILVSWYFCTTWWVVRFKTKEHFKCCPFHFRFCTFMPWPHDPDKVYNEWWMVEHKAKCPRCFSQLPTSRRMLLLIIVAVIVGRLVDNCREDHRIRLVRGVAGQHLPLGWITFRVLENALLWWSASRHLPSGWMTLRVLKNTRYF